MIKTFYYGRDPDRAVFGREQPLSGDVSETVREIIRDVSLRGDEALRDYTEKFDGVRLKELEVSREEKDEAMPTEILEDGEIKAHFSDQGISCSILRNCSITTISVG